MVKCENTKYLLHVLHRIPQASMGFVAIADIFGAVPRAEQHEVRQVKLLVVAYGGRNGRIRQSALNYKNLYFNKACETHFTFNKVLVLN